MIAAAAAAMVVVDVAMDVDVAIDVDVALAVDADIRVPVDVGVSVATRFSGGAPDGPRCMERAPRR